MKVKDIKNEDNLFDKKKSTKKRRLTLKNNVRLREKELKYGNISLYLDIYMNGVMYDTINLWLPIDKAGSFDLSKTLQSLSA